MADRPPFPPRATYRLQLNGDFGFLEARQLIPYLAVLGMSHIYASPIFEARPGSSHGYDTIDHRRLDPEIGTPEEFEAFVDELHEQGMGLVADFVPNHVGIGPDNPWWMDVLEWGRASEYAGYFDIDWDPLEPSLAGKVLLPVLGDHYGAVLERGEIRLEFDPERGVFAFSYFDQEFPLSPRDYARLLEKAAEMTAAGKEALAALGRRFRESLRPGGGRPNQRSQDVSRLKVDLRDLAGRDPGVAAALSAVVSEMNGVVGRPDSFDALHGLLETQNYRPAFWRTAAQEINYRRFFDINDLAGLRMENPELFAVVHELLDRLISEGKIQGVRLDHIDGLRDPKAYLTRLQELGGRKDTLYVLIEKILAPHERIRTDWPVAGTTGYDFMREVNGLFVDPAGEPLLTHVYVRFVERDTSYDQVAVAAKYEIMRESLSAELSALSNLLNCIAKQSRLTRDYSLTALREALVGVVAHFPVYRTYGDQHTGLSSEDRRELRYAVRRAQRSSRAPDLSVFDFVWDVLSLGLIDPDATNSGSSEYRRGDVLGAALRFQQYTGPVTAKAVEDTAFYRYVRLVSLNEVGGEPSRFGTSAAEFHEAGARRRENHPAALLATGTHDHKRGEDVRARLNVLSEVPRAWSSRVRRWARQNEGLHRRLETGPAPSAGDEYLLYQTVVGAWPPGMEPRESSELEAFRGRIDDYMGKAAREAKIRTSWTAPDAEYESVLSEFTRSLLDPGRSTPFLQGVADWVEYIGVGGAVNGLSQLVLKLTVPGVPDFYQGTELWDFSLVDPDNRRPVDYERRRRYLESAIRGEEDRSVDRRSAAQASISELLAGWQDGRIKQYVIARVLDARRSLPTLFSEADYRPLRVEGTWPGRIVAFARVLEDSTGSRGDPTEARAAMPRMVVIVPRCVWPLLEGQPVPLPSGWGDTAVHLPNAERRTFRDVLTGRPYAADDGGCFRVEHVLGQLPVSVLVEEL